MSDSFGTVMCGTSLDGSSGAASEEPDLDGFTDWLAAGKPEAGE
ncbi:hypothetical protein [Curtobacterium sp. ME12]|nr:hypothetical protein [Curtobacterium sp. ME12]